MIRWVNISPIGAIALALLLAGCATMQHGHPQQGSGMAASRGTSADHDQNSQQGRSGSYEARGKTFYVLKNANSFTQTGQASWYGRKFNGKPTASGQPFNMYAMTAAHKTLPIPSWVLVTNLDNHKHVVVKVNDRGPFSNDRIIDLSYAAARKLGIIRPGTAPVRIRAVAPAKAGHNHVASSGGRHNESSLHESETSGDEVASASTPHHDTIPSGSGTALQIGAFSNRANARRAKNKARLSGAHPVAVLPPSSGNHLYRVQVGPFSSSAALENARTRLASAGLPTYPVTE